MDRTFGVEIEMFGKREGQTMEDVKVALNAIGIDARVEPYNHAPRAWWKITTDGSISGSTVRYPMELVSPCLAPGGPLKGEEGLETLRKVCAVLESLGMAVNTSTGLHVHVGAADMTVEQVKSIVERYARYEDRIDAFMAPSRRLAAQTPPAPGPHYTQPIRGDVASRIINSRATNVGILATYQSSRYHTLNITAYNKHKTVEIRHHQGSVEAKKVCNWVRFVLSFVEFSCKQAATVNYREVPVVNDAPAARNRVHHHVGISPRRTSTKYAVALRVREGKTIAEIARIFGRDGKWVMFQVASMNRDFLCHFHLSGHRSLGDARKYEVIRWFGESRPTTRTVAETVASGNADPDTSVFAGMPEDIASFYEERTEWFARRSA